MMDYFWFLFRFDGRINRAKYWLALLILACWMLFVLMVLAGIVKILGIADRKLSIGTSTLSASWHFAAALLRGTEPMSVTTLFHLFFYAVTFPVTAVFAWAYAATSIKRLHDRNKSGWWIVTFLVLPPLLNTLWDWLDSPNLALLVSALAFCLSVWAFVELFCLRGSRGPNRFGPDPLAPPEPSPRSGTHWTQQDALEFVPLSASPSPSSHDKRGHD
jgi:uncharacterized membrane protein YhaH (DUF805 family)